MTKEAKARIKINKLLEESGWRFFDSEDGEANIQREIVARIECERAIVEGNRELIRLYEEKIKNVIERAWEG